MAPGALPLLGHAAQLKPSAILPFVESQAKALGEVFRMRMLNRDVVLISRPEHMQKVLLEDRANFVKGSAYDPVRRLMGMGLVTLEGSDWKARRRLAQPAFHMRSLQRLATTMVEITDEWIADLRARMPEGGRLDAHREMTKLTLDVVVATLFGRSITAHAEVPYELLSGALIDLSEFGNVPIPRWLPTPSNIRFKRTRASLDAVIYRLIAEGRRALARGEDEGSLMSMLLQARDEDTGEGLDDKALRDELMTLFLAGHETTALTMTWMFVLLAPVPEVVAKLQAEVDALPPGPPSYETLMAMQYTKQVVQEVLRLRPAAAAVMRDVIANEEIGGFALEPGDMVMPSFWLLHRDPALWPDPERFDPERFAPEAVKDRHRWAWLPFSGGPRVCIGNSFSLLESAVIIAALMRNAEFELVAGADVQPEPVATVRPAGEVAIALRWRD
ncbi:cytochrome P450 [Pseudenhygromyxa sp. WMMC2535]|uniref:cytochrome P450 n=1 Tax=Pseudenhygromyxa sp. WMMC2535 TaxID=2712867 RepID=UPI0015566E38|nr:cytochrome P450 [Pseudenhygromyxa sp. WMMC2535]NVB36353.1 cytochrome P450 [Pseudenhygromyxa sp. WMMC2535]